MHRLGSAQKCLSIQDETCPEDPVYEQFVALLRHIPRPTADELRAQQILLETHVDGSRYLLVRLPGTTNGAQLSPREREIVRMVSEGLPNKVIADVLNISCWTVSTHLRRIFAKLGVNSRAAMVAHLPELARDL